MDESYVGLEASEMEDDLLEAEFPPDNFSITSDDQMRDDQVDESSRPSRVSKTGRAALGHESSTASLTKMDIEIAEDLVQRHRQHLREMTDIGKVESKLLVNFSGRLNKASNAAYSAEDLSFESYVKELDTILERKQKAVSDLRAYLKKLSMN